MRGAIPLLHQYAFMTLCSVKAQGQLYLYLVKSLYFLLPENYVRGNMSVISRRRKTAKKLVLNTLIGYWNRKQKERREAMENEDGGRKTEM
jgi:hypothetical protein